MEDRYTDKNEEKNPTRCGPAQLRQPSRVLDVPRMMVQSQHRLEKLAESPRRKPPESSQDEEGQQRQTKRNADPEDW